MPSTGNRSSAARTATFLHHKCGIRFQYPAGWLVRETDTKGYPDPEPVCAFEVKPRNFDRIKETSEYELNATKVLVFPLSIYESPAFYVFAREEGDWVIMGRAADRSPTSELNTPYYIGAWGTGNYGVYLRNGPYVALGEARAALLNNRGTRTAVVFEGSYEANAYDLVVKSFRFLQSSAKKAAR